MPVQNLCTKQKNPADHLFSRRRDTVGQSVRGQSMLPLRRHAVGPSVRDQSMLPLRRHAVGQSARGHSMLLRPFRRAQKFRSHTKKEPLRRDSVCLRFFFEMRFADGFVPLPDDVECLIADDMFHRAGVRVRNRLGYAHLTQKIGEHDMPLVDFFATPSPFFVRWMPLPSSTQTIFISLNLSIARLTLGFEKSISRAISTDRTVPCRLARMRIVSRYISKDSVMFPSSLLIVSLR